MKTAVPEPVGEDQKVRSEAPPRGDSEDAGAAATLDDVLQSRIYETFPDAVLVTANGRVAFANYAARRLFGDATGNELIGRATSDLVHPTSRADAADRIAAALGSGGEAPSLRGSALRLDGEAFDFDAALARIGWNGGPACLLSLREGSQLGELAARLAEARDVADAANRTKSEFLANMSHELRTPLNAVMGFSEVIQNEMFGPVGVPQYVDYAADIYTSGAHLLEIINDILDLSKVEAGKLELAEERIDLRGIAEAVFQLVKGRADEGGVKLMHDIAPDLPRLHADKRKLKQMLLNLLSNAIKFTHQGGAVDLIARLGEDGGLVLLVRDTGIGIAADQFDHVLAPFGQVDSALAREHQGTGLGLPLVKALVELHGGRMVLESEPDTGTNISLCFPPERTQ